MAKEKKEFQVKALISTEQFEQLGDIPEDIEVKKLDKPIQRAEGLKTYALIRILPDAEKRIEEYIDSCSEEEILELATKQYREHSFKGAERNRILSEAGLKKEGVSSSNKKMAEQLQVIMAALGYSKQDVALMDSDSILSIIRNSKKKVA